MLAPSGAAFKSGGSRLLTSLQVQWEAWRDRRLDEEHVHFHLDGFALAVRRAGWVVRMMVLAVV